MPPSSGRAPSQYGHGLNDRKLDPAALLDACGQHPRLCRLQACLAAAQAIQEAYDSKIRLVCVYQGGRPPVVPLG
jgi:hypothetical protein